MDWSTALSTLVGAVVGVGSALVVDRARWRRERHQQRQQARQDAYVAYLAALHHANGAIRAISLGPDDAGTHGATTRAAFRSAGVVEAREHVILLAPESVAVAADAVFQCLRTLRDIVAQGQQLGSPDYELALRAYDDGLHALRDAIRADLGLERLQTRVSL
ncbi:MAG TPA: hypothetical protein VK891_04955 [Euzebyales bacterium]|nr:hypothetical protein [Euzebyales bacterium]